MYQDNNTRLHHMLDASKEAVSFFEGKERDQLDTDRKLALSVVKCIEIVGEAASNVTKEYRNQHPEIPWQLIIATRNRLIHGYFDIDNDRIWNTVKKNLPQLINSLTSIISD